ncbi:DUF3445 domain-containing protein [Ideonella sp. 4Y16]|nr:DUF3445 domain-containing protein [Ideonella alba]
MSTMALSFDFEHTVTAPFRMQPGLRRLAADTPQLTPVAAGSRHLREKVAVLQRWPTEALLTSPGADPTPALDALAAHAAQAHPTAWQVQPDGRWHAPVLGCTVAPDGTLQADPGAWAEPARALAALPAPLRRSALLALAFAEDLALVDGRDGSLAWLAVCLPSHWAPRDKIGRRFAEAHAPVADADRVRQAGAHLMKLVCGPDAWERFVWTITDSPWLHGHPDRAPHAWPRDLDPGRPGDAWFRTEHQCFLPLPALQQAIFTIGVQVRPLAEAVDTPERAQALHDTLASMSPAVLAYRALDGVQGPLLRWLAARAAA